MRKYVIERSVPGVGRWTTQQLRAGAETSNEAIARLAPDVQWVQAFVADDRMFCVYLARDEDVIRRHAELTGLPVTRIVEVRATIDPTTATAPAAAIESRGRAA